MSVGRRDFPTRTPIGTFTMIMNRFAKPQRGRQQAMAVTEVRVHRVCRARLVQLRRRNLAFGATTYRSIADTFQASSTVTLAMVIVTAIVVDTDSLDLDHFLHQKGVSLTDHPHFAQLVVLVGISHIGLGHPLQEVLHDVGQVR